MLRWNCVVEFRRTDNRKCKCKYGEFFPNLRSIQMTSVLTGLNFVALKMPTFFARRLTMEWLMLAYDFS
jgi:hypothetical protein